MDVLVGKITTKTVDGKCVVENAGLKYLDKLNLIGCVNNVNDFIELCLKNCEKKALIYMLDLKLQASVILHSLIEMTAIQFIPTELYYFDKNYTYTNCINKPNNYNEFFYDAKDGIYYKSSVGELGDWYSLEVWQKSSEGVKHITFRDFSKIFVGESYKTLALDFLNIPFNEYLQGVEALKRDLFILGRSVKICREDWGITETTAAGAAMEEFKKHLFKSMLSVKATKPMKEALFRKIFPTLKSSITEFCYTSYRGGFIYSSDIELKNNTPFLQGVVLDINSLYSYVMRTKQLPIGEPKKIVLKDTNYDKLSADDFQEQIKAFWTPSVDDCIDSSRFRVIRFICSFEVKSNGIPFVMLKNAELGSSTNIESGASELPADTILKTSDMKEVELTMNSIDFFLFCENYHIRDLTFIEAYEFKTEQGYFDSYIDFWYDKKTVSRESGNKIESKVSKLMLNSLSGKFGAKLKRRWKVPVVENGILNYRYTSNAPASVVYMPMASAITAWGRYVLFNYIRTVCMLLDCDSVFERLLYSDTDSLHILLSEEELKKLNDIISKDLGDLKIEHRIYDAKYMRSKVYILKVEEDKLKVSCSGMPKSSQDKITFDNFNSDEVLEGARKIYVEGIGGIVEKTEDFRLKRGCVI